MKKPRKRKPDVIRPFCDGTMSQAEFVTFVKSQLRGARWPAKFKCFEKTYIGEGINPATGRKCKLHKCPLCGRLFPQKGMCADHIVPVIGPEGFTTWDSFISRLFCDSEGFQSICKECHKIKTDLEAEQRKQHKQQPTREEDLFNEQD